MGMSIEDLIVKRCHRLGGKGKEQSHGEWLRDSESVWILLLFVFSSLCYTSHHPSNHTNYRTITIVDSARDYLPTTLLCTLYHPFNIPHPFSHRNS